MAVCSVGARWAVACAARTPVAFWCFMALAHDSSNSSSMPSAERRYVLPRGTRAPVLGTGMTRRSVFESRADAPEARTEQLGWRGDARVALEARLDELRPRAARVAILVRRPHREEVRVGRRRLEDEARLVRLDKRLDGRGQRRDLRAVEAAARRAGHETRGNGAANAQLGGTRKWAARLRDNGLRARRRRAS